MPTTDQDLRALAYLARRLREETHGANRWDEAGIHAVVAKLSGRNLAVTIEQVTRHAADPEAKTPGAINRPFLPDKPEPETYRPPRKAEECPRHAGNYADACRGCAADQRVGDVTAPGEPRKPDRGAHLATVRAELTAIKSRLCGHGIDRQRGRCHQCETAKTDHDPRRQPAEQETETA